MSIGIIVRGKHEVKPRHYSSKEITDSFGHLEDHQYRHFNRSLGCEVKSKEHYFHLLEKGGYVPKATGDRLAEEWRKKNTKKPYEVSEKTLKVIGELKASSGKGGKLDLEHSKRACESIGMKFNRDLSQLPAHYLEKGGGFYDGKA